MRGGLHHSATIHDALEWSMAVWGLEQPLSARPATPVPSAGAGPDRGSRQVGVRLCQITKSGALHDEWESSLWAGYYALKPSAGHLSSSPAECRAHACPLGAAGLSSSAINHPHGPSTSASPVREILQAPGSAFLGQEGDHRVVLSQRWWPKEDHWFVPPAPSAPLDVILVLAIVCGGDVIFRVQVH